MELDSEPIKTRRSRHRTQWAAQFAVASELCKRGYEVSITLGNHPIKDLMVCSPNGLSFGIDVKGLYKKTDWLIKKRENNSNVFYIFAFVPDDQPNQYFILSQTQVNEGIDDYISSARATAVKKGNPSDHIGSFPGIRWNYAAKFKDEWCELPG